MGILDRLNAFADKLGIQSEGYGRKDPQPDSYGQPADYGNQPPPSAGAESEAQQQYVYESNYGTGARVISGVKPRNAQPAKGRGFLDGLLERINQARQPSSPEPPPPDNVIPLNTTEPPPSDPYATGRERPLYQPTATQQPPTYGEDPIPEPEPAQMARQTYTTMIFLVRDLSDAQEIIGHMLDRDNVIVNMEEIDDVIKQRVLDMVSGAAYALDCSLERISFRNYLIAPSGEEIYSNASFEREAPPTGGRYRSRDRR